MSTFIDDLFAGAGGTNLSAHVGPNGETWGLATFDASGVILLSGSSTCYSSYNGGNSLYLVSNKFGTTVDQTATITVNLKTASAGQVVGFIIESNANGDAGYYLLIDTSANTAKLYVSTASYAFAQLQSVSLTLADGDTVSVHINGAFQEILHNGVSAGTPTTDNRYLPADATVLHSGLWLGGLASTSTTLAHISEFKVVDNGSLALGAPAPQITAQSKTSATLSETPVGDRSALEIFWSMYARMPRSM